MAPLLRRRSVRYTEHRAPGARTGARRRLVAHPDRAGRNAGDGARGPGPLRNAHAGHAPGAGCRGRDWPHALRRHRHWPRNPAFVARGSRRRTAALARHDRSQRRRGARGGQFRDGRTRDDSRAPGGGFGRLADRVHGERCGDGGTRRPAPRRRDPRCRTSLPAALGLAMALGGRAGGRVRPAHRGGAGRYAGGRSGAARETGPGAEPIARLAQGAGGARGRVGGALDGRRRQDRGRRRAAACSPSII